jgi:hypothetical protein
MKRRFLPPRGATVDPADSFYSESRRSERESEATLGGEAIQDDRDSLRRESE